MYRVFLPRRNAQNCVVIYLHAITIQCWWQHTTLRRKRQVCFVAFCHHRGGLSSGESTGDRQQNVSPIAFSAKSIIVLWDHEASESVSEAWASYTDKYAWNYSEFGMIIHVTGKRTVGEFADTAHGWAPYTAHDLPGETFCWKNEQLHYASCKGRQRG